MMPFSYPSLFLKQDALLANILYVLLYMCLAVALVIWALGLLTCWCLFSTEDGLLVSGGQDSSKSFLVLGQVVHPCMMNLFSSEVSRSEPDTSALHVTKSQPCLLCILQTRDNY